MYKGKATCKILKEIRKQIAKENDIAFVTAECKYQGDCRGTCPACEAEVRYLEEELHKRKQMGKKAIVTGVSLGLATSFLGCHFGGNADDSSEPATSSEPVKQERTLSAAPNSEQKSFEAGSPKQSQRSYSTIFLGEERIKGELHHIDKNKQNDSQPYTSDTIEIIYEFPRFDLDGTISSTCLPDTDTENHGQSDKQSKRAANKGTR